MASPSTDEKKKKKEYKTVHTAVVAEMVLNVKNLKVGVLEYVEQEITDSETGNVETEKLFHLTINQKGFATSGEPKLETIRMKLSREELDKLINGLNMSKPQADKAAQKAAA